jgi:hypothetical protein
MKEQTRQQIEEGVGEMRHLLDLFERGVLEQEFPGEAEKDLRLVLRDRELWLKGGIFVSIGSIGRQSAEAIGISAQSKLEYVEDDARMCTKSQAIEYLRSMGHFGCLNHEPLRKVEREWLARIFVRERCSRAWIGLAAVMATAEEQGIHVEDHLQIPCRCLDSVNRRVRSARRNPR